MSEEGSKGEPAGPTRVKGCHVLMPSKHWPYTSAEKHYAAQLHPSLPSRALAKHRHNPHPLQALCSLNLAAPAYRKQEEYSSFFPSLCCSTLFSICSHAYKGTHLVSPILHHRANGACHQDLRFLHTSRVCDPALLSPESAQSVCPPLLQLA